MFDVDAALHHLVNSGGSDLHLKAGSAPQIRLNGKLTPLPGNAQLGPDETEATLRHLLTDPSKLAEFAADCEVDFAYSIDGLARFRVNAFRQRGSISLVLRAIPFAIRT